MTDVVVAWSVCLSVSPSVTLVLGLGRRWFTWLRSRTCQPMINRLALFGQFSSLTSLCSRLDADMRVTATILTFAVIVRPITTTAVVITSLDTNWLWWYSGRPATFHVFCTISLYCALTCAVDQHQCLWMHIYYCNIACFIVLWISFSHQWHAH